MRCGLLQKSVVLVKFTTCVVFVQKIKYLHQFRLAINRQCKKTIEALIDFYVLER